MVKVWYSVIQYNSILIDVYTLQVTEEIRHEETVDRNRAEQSSFLCRNETQGCFVK